MKIKPSTEWKVIADAFATPLPKRTKAQRRLTHIGLCFSQQVVCCDNGIKSPEFPMMSQPVRVPGRGGYKTYWFPVRGDVNFHRRHDLARARLALNWSKKLDEVGQ